MAKTRYRLRNAQLEVLGEYYEKELFAQILSGKLTGEEEIAQAPFQKWVKVASHPIFFDGFIRRLYKKDYGLPEEEAEVSSRESVEPSITNHEHSSEGTNRSEIEALFGKEPDVPAGGGTQVHAAGKTDLILIEPPPELLPEAHPDGTPPIESPLKADRAQSKWLDTPRKRKVLLGVVVVVLVAVVLWPSDPDVAVITEKAVTGENSLSSLSNPASVEERAQTLSSEGAVLMAQDTLLFYRGAREVLKDAVSLNDKDAALLGKLAVATARTAASLSDSQRLKTEIQRLIQRARLTDPHASDLYLAEAILAQAEGKQNDAKALAAKAGEADPTSAESLLLTGELHYASGDLELARTAVMGAVKLDPSRVRGRYYAGLIAFEGGDLATAKSEAIEALKLNPLHPKTYLLLADIAAQENRLNEARGLYETCGKLARFTVPLVPGKAYQRLGEINEITGNKAQAQNDFLLAYHYLGGQGAEVRKKVKGLDLSEKNLTALAASAEYHAAYFSEQANGLLNQGKLDEAVRFYQAAQLLEPQSGMALIHVGEALEKAASSYEDFRRVMSYYQRAIDRDPKEPMGYIKLGSLESEQYNFDRGYKLILQAVALAPESEKPYAALGKHFYRKQDYNEALNQFLHAAKINSADSEILYYAGKLRLIYKKDGAKDAIRFFNQAYTIDPRNYDALTEWLKLKVAAHEKNFAVRFLKELISGDPKNAQNYWALGEIYAEAKEYRRAIGFFHKSLDIDNRQSKVRMSLGKALEAVGELDKAVAEYRLSSLLDRRNSEGFYRAADLLFQMKAYQQSEDVLKFLIGVTPNYPGVHRYLSKIYQLRELKDAAVDQMVQEVANNPNNYKFVLELAELYMEYENFDKAIEELKKVTALPSLSQAPEFKAEKTRAYLLLSRCYRAKNLPESGEAAIHLALSIDANDPELHRELGYVYYAMQRDKEGVKEFEIYLERNPAATDATAIRGLIKRMTIEE